MVSSYDQGESSGKPSSGEPQRGRPYQEMLRKLDKQEKEMLQEIKDDLSDILHILHGNGKLGLVAKVEVMWRGGVWMFGTCVGAVIGSSVTFLVMRFG